MFLKHNRWNTSEQEKCSLITEQQLCNYWLYYYLYFLDHNGKGWLLRGCAKKIRFALLLFLDDQEFFSNRSILMVFYSSHSSNKRFHFFHKIEVSSLSSRIEIIIFFLKSHPWRIHDRINIYLLDDSPAKFVSAVSRLIHSFCISDCNCLYCYCSIMMMIKPSINAFNSIQTF